MSHFKSNASLPSLIAGVVFAAMLVGPAIAAENIDEAKAEESRQRAEAKLHEKLSAEEDASVNAALARALAQLRVKRGHRIR